MNFLSKSVNDFIKETFHKNSSDLLISDLLLIEYITIDGRDEDNNRQRISYNDLVKLKNLKYLEIANTTITPKAIAIIRNLEYLENIVFRNCTFNKQITSLDTLTNIKSLRIVNCKKFKISFINKLNNLERLYISDDTFTNLQKFNKLNLQALDISNCSLDDDKGIEKIKTNYLVISSKQYSKFNDKLAKLNSKIMVMADPKNGYYIEKWIN